MIKEAIEKIEALSATTIKTHAGKGYVFVGDELTPLDSLAALAVPLEFHSLSGLVAYLASDLDGSDPSTLAFIVDGPDKVRLAGSLTAEFRQREVLASASPYLSKPFDFGRYLDIETFVTSLQSGFEQDENTATILKIVGNISQEVVATLVDDGVSQQVTARAGIAKQANVVVPNPVSLRPFRTFPEVFQPWSKYVLRVKRGGEGALPSAALFEVGDNAWKHAAVDSIAKRIGELLTAAKVKAVVLA